MEISVCVKNATFEELIIFEAIYKPMIDEFFEEVGILKSSKLEVKKEN